MLKFIFKDNYCLFDFLGMYIVFNYVYQNPGIAGVLIGFSISLIFIFLGLIGKAVSESRMK